MNFKRLFHVLVVGGSVLGCEKTRSDALSKSSTDGPARADAERVSDSEPAGESDVMSTLGTAGGDANLAADAAFSDAAGADAAAADGLPGETPSAELCFCSPTKCCDQHEGSAATVSAGFECCWGTNC